MADRTVTDASGRVWTCASPTRTAEQMTGDTGRDVTLSCSTSSVAGPVNVIVGWQWERMSENGLGRVLTSASPLPRNLA